MRYFIALSFALLLAPLGHAQLPPPVARGLAAVKAGDFDQAVDEWTKSWPSTLDTDSARLRLKSGFSNLVLVAGTPQGWEIVKQVAIGKLVQRYYILIECARDPAYLVLEAYQRPDSSWTVERLQFNANLMGLQPLDVAQFLTGP